MLSEFQILLIQLPSTLSSVVFSLLITETWFVEQVLGAQTHLAFETEYCFYLCDLAGIRALSPLA